MERNYGRGTRLLLDIADILDISSQPFVYNSTVLRELFSRIHEGYAPVPTDTIASILSARHWTLAEQVLTRPSASSNGVCLSILRNACLADLEQFLACSG